MAGAPTISASAPASPMAPMTVDMRILLGGNFRTRVLSYSESFPLDGALTVGAGLNVGDGDDLIYLPVGLSVGRRFELEGSKTTFTPYVHPTLIPVIGASGGSDVGFALGLGVDMRLGRELGRGGKRRVRRS